MSDESLKGCCILVVEDEYLIADQVRSELNGAGAVVLGPAPTVADALDLVRSERQIDGAVLDVGLRDETAYAVADLLAECGVPYVFLTGYDASVIPGRFQHVVRCEKPVTTGIIRAIGHAIRSPAPALCSG